VSALALDTHAWVWWVSKPEKLSRTQRTAIERARQRGGDALLLSVISGWEVALLTSDGRIDDSGLVRVIA
jgi:PIN domain nuclease of toxin-antitoxin system